MKQVVIYPQKSKPFVHVDVTTVVAQGTAVRVVVVVVHVDAVLAGTEPLVMRPVRVASIKCHFHEDDL